MGSFGLLILSPLHSLLISQKDCHNVMHIIDTTFGGFSELLYQYIIRDNRFFSAVSKYNV